LRFSHCVRIAFIALSLQQRCVAGIIRPALEGLMLKLSPIPYPDEVRQLARDLLAAQDEYTACFRVTCRTDLAPEVRVDAELAHGAAKIALGAAAYALHVAQRDMQVAA
jgi:hypothetical protein